MASAFLSTPPAPSPSVTCPDSHDLPSHCLLQLCHKKSRIWVEVFLLIGVFLSLFTHLANGRRYTSRTWTFRYPLWAAYLTIASVVSYTLGMMSDQPPALHSNLYFPWGIMFIVIAYQLKGSISAFSLDDNENGMKMLLEQVLLSVYIFGALPPSGEVDGHSFNVRKWSLVAFCVLSILVYGETAYARMIASLSSKGVVYWVGADIASYMEKEHQLADNDSMDPSSMVGYRYFVDFMKGRKVTIEDIWSCQGKVLCTGNRQKDDRRKDLCLSFAFFWLLLRRYGGYPLHEARQDKTWRLVSENLLPDDGGEPERAFKVIELELHFLYDFFYTKHCALYVLWPNWLYFYHCFVISMCISLTLGMINSHALYEDTGAVQFLGINLDIIVTWMLLVTFVILYILKGFSYATSIWTRVQLMCYYVQKNLFNDWFLEMILRMDWAMRRPNWERKLGQYSFLVSYAYVPWYRSACNAQRNGLYSFLDSFFMLFDLPRNGQREEKRINLSKQVKEAIGRSIKKNGHKLSDGVEALRGHGFNVERLSQIYPSNSIAEHILTWHIATSLAAKDRGARPSGEDWNEYDVAVSLSKY
ncbi:hypothetical protein Droror1_Dr00020687 [Drosera rotundifolia]